MIVSPVPIEDFLQMEIDTRGQLDFGVDNYWEQVIPLANTVGVYLDDRCVFLLGGVIDKTGVMTIFAIPSIHSDNLWVKKQILKYAAMAFKLLQGDEACHFMQAIVRADQPLYARFIEHFGFEGGYRLPGYTPAGEDVLFYYRQLPRQQAAIAPTGE